MHNLACLLVIIIFVPFFIKNFNFYIEMKFFYTIFNNEVETSCIFITIKFIHIHNFFNKKFVGFILKDYNFYDFYIKIS